MATAVPTPKEWISRQTKCNQCCYHNTKKCMHQRCYKSEGVDDVYFIE